MTRSPDIERALDQWLAEGPTELADRIFEDALRDIDRTPQLGAHGAPWRYNDMPTTIRLLLVAALVAATAGAVIIVGGVIRDDDASPAPSTAPPTPLASAVVGAGAVIGSDPQGTWIASRPAAFGADQGEFQLLIEAPVRHLFAQSPAGPRILLGTVELPEPGVVELGLTDRCFESTGRYRYAVADTLNTLTLGLIDDSCTDRVALLTGDWDRLGLSWELASGQRYRLPMADGSLDFTIPASFESVGGGRPTIAGEASPSSYVVIQTDRAQLWILNGRGAPSARCHAAGGSDANLNTLEAFDEWAGLDAGLSTSNPVSFDIGGHAAHRVDVTAGDRCDQPWTNMQPMNLRAGGHDRVWAIQLDDRLVLLQLVNDNPPLAELTPELLAAADELIGSMAFEMAP